MILEEGWEKGRAEGQAVGQIRALRQTIVDIVQVRFPDLVGLTEKQIATTSNLNLLRHLSIELITAQSLEQARRILLDQ